MEELGDISGQRFYYSIVDKVIEQCSPKEKCAIIVDENYLDEFLDTAKELVGESVNQLIIISENLTTALSQLEGVNVLLISVKSLDEAVKIAVLGEYSSEVIYLSKKDGSELQRAIELIES